MVQLARAIRELTRTREVNDVEQPNQQLAIEPPVEMRRDPPYYAPPPRAVQSQTLQRPPLPLRNNVGLQDESAHFRVLENIRTV